MKRSLTIISCVVLLLMLCLGVVASPPKGSQEDVGTTVTLVTSGTGSTKEEATKNALRSAIEQTFGTFVSANTAIVNEDLVKDEIVSISTGNIQSYQEVSCENMPNGEFDVTVKAVVSIGKLVSFAQNKGMTAELAGNTFLMNRNIALLNKKNEALALVHLREKIGLIAEKGLFDFSINVGQPQGKGPFKVRIEIIAEPNKNMDAFWRIIDETLKSLNMSREECANYEKLGFNTFNVCYDPSIEEDMKLTYRKEGYRLRNEVCSPYSLGGFFELLLTASRYSYEVYDNLGTVIITYLIRRKDSSDVAMGAEGFYKFHIGRTNYSIGLVGTSESVNNEKIIENPWNNKNYIEMIYQNDKLAQLQNISIRPHLIRIKN